MPVYDVSDPAEPLLARSAVEWIGSNKAGVSIRSPKGEIELVQREADHGVAVQLCLDQLTSPEFGVLSSANEVAAIGFKAVHAWGVSGVQPVNERVLDAMEQFAAMAPAHNPLHPRNAGAPRPLSENTARGRV